VMITSCESCGHKLWSVVRKVDKWELRLHFDGEESSETYADHITSCPGCGKWLAEPAVWEYYGVRVTP
jgi:hypothetical protein